MTAEPIYRALPRLEHADITAEDRETLRPAFAALHGATAFALPECIVERIRVLNAKLSVA